MTATGISTGQGCCKKTSVKAEIVSIGTEILLGEITDTNASYLAGQLPLLGIDLYRVTQVGDNQSRITEVLGKAWNRSDLIIITGGLGPTEDDLTRESIAGMLGEEMQIDPDLENWLRDKFDTIGYPMPDNNLKQCTLVPSARAIPNSRGTAPGWWVSRDGKALLAMPGPPGEMMQMWKSQVRDELRRNLDTAVIVSRTLKMLGVGEANIDKMISHLLASNNPSIGVYAKQTGIELRITAKASNREEAGEMIAPVETEIRSMVGDRIWGVDEEVMEQVVGDLLRKEGMTLASMESCTGGLLASIITDVPGSSEYFKGGLVTYTNEMKVDFGVDAGLINEHGVVSAEVAEAMAVAVRNRLGSDIGVGITGVAGPDEIEGKPVGTVYIGISDGKTTKSIRTGFPQHRKRIKHYAVMNTLDEIRRLLKPD